MSRCEINAPRECGRKATHKIECVCVHEHVVSLELCAMHFESAQSAQSATCNACAASVFRPHICRMRVAVVLDQSDKLIVVTR